MQSFITWLLQLSVMLYFQTVTCLQLETNQVVIKDFNMSLVCRVSTTINFTITIENPTGGFVTCSPSGFFPASCTDNGYAIDETAKTVTMTKVAQSNDDGTWKCEYDSDPIQSTTKNIVVETLVPINGEPLHINTTAADGKTLTSVTNDVFNAIYGCFSSAVKFKWNLAADSWQIASSASTVYTCATPGTSAYVATQTASEIWSHIASGTKQTLSVTVLTMENYELSKSTFSVYFSKGWCGFDSKVKCGMLIFCIVIVLSGIYILIHWVCCNANCKKCQIMWCCYESCYCKCPEKGFPCCPHHFDCSGQDCSCCNPLLEFKGTLISKSHNNVTPSDDAISGDHEDSRNTSGSSHKDTPRSEAPVSDWHQTPKSIASVSYVRPLRNTASVSDGHPTPKGSWRPLPLPENYQPNLPDPPTGGNNKK